MKHLGIALITILTSLILTLVVLGITDGDTPNEAVKKVIPLWVVVYILVFAFNEGVYLLIRG